MRISEVRIEESPRSENPDPVQDALQTLSGGGAVRVRITTEDGTEGSGSASFGRIPGASRALAGLIDAILKPLVLNKDILRVRELHAEMMRETEYFGSFGLAMFGISAIDTAIWDCIGKVHNVPCWQLWGAARASIPAYAMVGWLNYSEEKLREICVESVTRGFRAVKIKVGFKTLAEDIRRIKIVREAVGDAIRIMVDANQALTVGDAIQRGRAYQELGVYWWEEPIPAHDAQGYKTLCDALDIPVATGENLYTLQDFAHFLSVDAIDIVQADLRRAGGPTVLLAIGSLAAAHGRPYASHGGGPVQLNIMACLDNVLYLETGLSDDVTKRLLPDGTLPLPDGPGFSWARDND